MKSLIRTMFRVPVSVFLVAFMVAPNISNYSFRLWGPAAFAQEDDMMESMDTSGLPSTGDDSYGDSGSSKKAKKPKSAAKAKAEARAKAKAAAQARAEAKAEAKAKAVAKARADAKAKAEARAKATAAAKSKSRSKSKVTSDEESDGELEEDTGESAGGDVEGEEASETETKPKSKTSAKSKAKAKADAKKKTKASKTAKAKPTPEPIEEEKEEEKEEEVEESEPPPEKAPKKASKTKAPPEPETEELDEEPATPAPVRMSSAAYSRSGSYARDLAIRTVGIGKITVRNDTRRFVPAGFEARLGERIIQDLKSKTYLDPRQIDGVYDNRTSGNALAQAARKSNVDGVLVFEIGLEEIIAYLSSRSGTRVKGFEFRFKVGELEEKNAVSILGDRIIEGVVQLIPYRGFITAIEKGRATVNLGSDHQVKEGDMLELFEFRRPSMNATRRLISEVQVKKVLGPGESVVGPPDESTGSMTVEPFAKVSFSLSKSMAIEATDHSVVAGKWWFGFGGQLDSFGAEAAAPKFESRLFKVNGAPFGYVTGGNDILTLRGGFGSARSESETLNFIDAQGLYSLYQLGGAQSAWNFSAGGRVFMINVVPLPNKLSALTSTMIVSPVAEAKYQYVPKGRVRLGASGEIFWPVYTSGAEIGALIFAFGAGAGVNLQVSVTQKLGIEVFGKLRYIRRPIEGQSGVQERQSTLGAGLVFAF